MTTSSSSKPRIGLLARADTGGLAAQTHDFYLHMKPTKTAVIVIDELTGYKSDLDKYVEADYWYCPMFEPTFEQLDGFLRDIDIVFTVETPYNHNLFSLARARGIKTVLQYNHEWLQHHQEPDLPKPDLFLAPSEWNRDKMPWPTKYLHVPVDREKFPFKQRSKAKKFLHIAGHRTFGDRNGTATLLDALPLIKSNVEIIIRTQDELPRPYTDHKLTIIRDDVGDRRDLYNDEDVLILPRKYGGLSLQLNEALSLGMVPIMLNIPPQNGFLLKESLVAPHFVEKTMIKTPIDVFTCAPEDLAKKIDDLAAQDISYFSKESGAIAHLMDWHIMKPQYEALFVELCSQ
jgi:hypothetical protein